MIINVIIAILIIGFLVVAHEFGHFIVAKANGVAVVEFAIGFGPRIFHIKKGETDYALRLMSLSLWETMIRLLFILLKEVSE